MQDFQKSTSSWTTMNTSKLINICIIIIEVIKVAANKLLSNFCNSIGNCNRSYIRLNVLRRKNFRNMGYSRNFPLVRHNSLMKWWINYWCYWSCQKVSQFFEILWEIPSGPTDLFNLPLLSSERTSSISTVYWDGRGDNLFLKSSNRDWSSVGMCFVTSHKCVLIVLAKLTPTQNAPGDNHPTLVY